ncbi:hypothetical protein LIA77_06798 [Sarocladium implicatum]|nr:hypothetical protein LIA77_06798 [Sarocladium implicatum]
MFVSCHNLLSSERANLLAYISILFCDNLPAQTRLTQDSATMFLLSVLMMGSLALAENRIFNSLGDKECQSCLGGVESKCRGPTSSDQFNDCFCSIGDQGLAWPKLTDCLTGSNAQCAEEDQYQILSYWGAHCFAYKDDEEEQVCVDSTQDDNLTSATSSSSSTETTATTVSESEETSDAEDSTTTTTTTTTSDAAAAVSTTEASETSTTSRPTAGDGSGSGADTGSGRESSDSQDDEGDEDDGVAALLPTSSGTIIAALCFSLFLARLL